MRVKESEPDARASEGSLARRQRVAGMMVPERQRDLGHHSRMRRINREVEALGELAFAVQEVDHEGPRRADQRLRPDCDTIILPRLPHRQTSAS